MVKYPNLFSPIKIGSLTLKNRIMSAPTSMAELENEGYMGRENIAYYKLRAKGGASVITLGDCIVQGATGKSHPKQILMDDPDVIPGLVKLTDAIKQHSAVASIELDHGGRECSTRFIKGLPMGPVYEANYFGREIQGMTIDQIESVTNSFVEAAATAKFVGFDMVTIHAGHGWLLSQFLSPTSNKRKDEYGGNIENRARFVLNVVEGIRKRCGPDFPIEVRISGAEFMPGGYGIEEGVEIAKILDGKVDLIHVSAGTFEDIPSTVIMHPSMFMEHGCNVFLAAEIKKHVKIPVATVGSISIPSHMEEIISSGKADIVAVARAMLADPYLPKKAKEGRDEDIRPCIRCFVCEGGMFATRTMRCTVNPVIGREFESQFLIPPAVPKKVLIAGGGPGGMQAAITAAERGHDVLLCEKTGSLGGAIKYSEHVSFKKDLYRFWKYLERQIHKSDVAVMLNTQVTPEFVKKISPDVLIAAVGAEPVVPSIPGINNKNVYFADDIHKPDTKIGNKVVIIGGGLMGCETGIHLKRSGKDVTVLEMLGEPYRDANLMHKRALAMELSKGITVKTETKCVEINDKGVAAIGPDGKEQLFEADTVIYAVGIKARTDVVDRLRGSAPEFVWIGDCNKPQKVTEAVRAGYDAAMDI